MKFSIFSFHDPPLTCFRIISPGYFFFLFPCSYSKTTLPRTMKLYTVVAHGPRRRSIGPSVHLPMNFAIFCFRALFLEILLKDSRLKKPFAHITEYVFKYHRKLVLAKCIKINDNAPKTLHHIGNSKSMN